MTIKIRVFERHRVRLEGVPQPLDQHEGMFVEAIYEDILSGSETIEEGVQRVVDKFLTDARARHILKGKGISVDIEKLRRELGK